MTQQRLTKGFANMLVDLRALSDGPRTFEFENSADELDLLSTELRFKAPIRTSCRAALAGDALLVDGFVCFLAEVECSRCLRLSALNLAVPFNRVYRRAPQDQPGAPGQSEDDEADVISGDAQTVDISTAVREAIILEAPMKPLCTEGCLGLCPVCGRNLNDDRCDCSTKRTDPRWGALKEIVTSNGQS